MRSCQPRACCRSVISAGIFGILAAPFISRLLPLFPPVVTGTIIPVIGISLMRVGINSSRAAAEADALAVASSAQHV